MFSKESWQLLSENLPAVILDPSDIAARSAMQLGAAYAGVAIENSMLGAAHALANPLTATCGTAHGWKLGYPKSASTKNNYRSLPLQQPNSGQEHSIRSKLMSHRC